MIVDRARTRLYVACDNSDSVVVLDAATGNKRAEILTRAPQSLLSAVKDWKGANPNNLALSPDGRMLFVTNGGMNALAVVQLAADALEGSGNERSEESAYGAESESHVVGLIPTGWYPNAVAVSTDGTMLYVVNGKSNAGPNPTRLPRHAVIGRRREYRVPHPWSVCLATQQGGPPRHADAGPSTTGATDAAGRPQRQPR